MNEIKEIREKLASKQIAHRVLPTLNKALSISVNFLQITNTNTIIFFGDNKILFCFDITKATESDSWVSLEDSFDKISDELRNELVYHLDILVQNEKSGR